MVEGWQVVARNVQFLLGITTQFCLASSPPQPTFLKIAESTDVLCLYCVEFATVKAISFQLLIGLASAKLEVK